MKLTEYFERVYKKDPEIAVRDLRLGDIVEKNGWEWLFKEAVGDGICSPKESIVAVFDEDDLDRYHDYVIYPIDDGWKPISKI